MIKRKIERMLSEGRGKQLLWLILLIIVVLMVLLFINWQFIGMSWQDIIPGFFGVWGHGDHQLFKVITGLSGRVLFSALLISIFVKIFDNISNSYRKGENRYPFSNHVLIIGAGKHLKDMLLSIRNKEGYVGKEILVMTAVDVEQLRKQIEIQLADVAFCRKINYFHRERHTLDYLKDAHADKACAIYILGEDDETGHDSLSIRCLNLLKELCVGNSPVIPCYLVMEMHTTLNVFNYMKDSNSSRLDIEVINESDYAVERIMTGTDFLPAFTRGDNGKRLHLVVAGNSEISRSFAIVAAQICHYPNYNGGNTRTKISLIGYGKEERESFIASHFSLFELCHYRYVSPEKVEEYMPKSEYGDFMDVEWEFVDGDFMSPSVRNLMESWANNSLETMAVAVCFNNDETNAYMALHLPRSVYDNNVNIAICQNGYTELMKEAISTGIYGKIYLFGNSSAEDDSLFLKRTAMGKRVNRVYDMEYGNPPANDEEEAWKGLPYAHKYSSIASANSITMKMRCFRIEPTIEHIRSLSDDEKNSLSEVEHRRWMVTQLLMGYSAATIDERRDRSHFKELKNEKFIHLDIAPYDELPGEEEKDLLIINNIPYIVMGKLL